MANKPHKPPVEFKTRMPSLPPTPRPPGPPAKRSGHVALFLMGTLAVGSTAYMLMPRNKCEQPPNTPSPSLLQSSNADCPPRGSSSGSSGSGGSSSRTGYYSSDSSSSHSSSSTSAPGSSNVARGGFGSFGHAFGFSGG
jgi:hypothetical protein